LECDERYRDTAGGGQQTVGQNTTYWWTTTSNLRLVLRAATKDSIPISPQAIGRRVAALKAVIHAIAVNWCQLEDLALPAWRLRALPVIGSDQWDTQLAAELTYYDEPEPHDAGLMPDTCHAIRQDPAGEQSQ